MLKYISRVHKNHSNNLEKLIVYLMPICFGSDFTLALAISLEVFVSQEKRKQKTAYLANDSPRYSPVTNKTNFNQDNNQKCVYY